MQNTAQKGRKKYKRNGKHSKQNYKNHMARKIRNTQVIILM